LASERFRNATDRFLLETLRPSVRRQARSANGVVQIGGRAWRPRQGFIQPVIPLVFQSEVDGLARSEASILQNFIGNYDVRRADGIQIACVPYRMMGLGRT
jgi:hypothetical protein